MSFSTILNILPDALAVLVLILFGLNILLLFMFGLHSYLMVYLYHKRAAYCQTDREVEYQPLNLKQPGRLPQVTIQLPVYNEFYVVDRLLAAVSQIKWPRHKLEIQVLDDSTDETRDKLDGLVQRYKRRGFIIKHLHRTKRQGHKAGALKAGLTLARGGFIAIFDADFVPASDFLLRTIPFFADPAIGMVQTRWGHINGNYSMLTKAQAIGLDGHFVVEQVARNANQLWMNFNGTGGIWRKQCILDAGNWQADTLTEDFDLSYRAELAGWKFRYFKDVVNPAEIPATIAAYRSQQFRWCKGSLQTAVKLIPRILGSTFGWKIKAEATVHLLNYSVHPLMVLNILLLLPVLTIEIWSDMSYTDFPLLVLFAAASLLGVATFGPLTFYSYSQRELYQDWRQRLWYLPMLTILGSGIALSNTRAYLEAVIGKQSAFQRTPKLRIESQNDLTISRKKYRQAMDPMFLLEIGMGLYCLGTVYFAVVADRFLVTGFLLLYAAGFFYIGLGSLWEVARQRMHDTGWFQKTPALSAGR
ncbi:MAG: glycosyltransferase family 2 protein [Leptospiraceae bacterium]|nr:glycosyltransferase family 2 protein [Leptospiraceae bacterium]